jgi:hypothetical protein
MEDPRGDGIGGSMYGPILSKALRGANSVFIPEVAIHRPKLNKLVSSLVELPGYTILSEVLRSADDLDSLATQLLEVTDPTVWAETLVNSLELRINEDIARRTEAIRVDPLNPRDVPRLVVRVKKPTPQELQSILSYGSLIKAWPKVVEASKLILNNRSNGLTVTL